MIRIFILALLVLLSTVYITLFAKADPGYALLSRGDWSVEMTLVLLVLGLIASMMLIFILIYLLYKVLGIPEKVIRWNSDRKHKRANKNANAGMIQLAEGNWKDAERFLGKDVNASDTPLLNFIAAAKAAQEQGKLSQRDNYLLLAFKHYPQAKLAICISQAELEIAAKQYEQALLTLKHIQEQAPYHGQVLKMLVDLYNKMSKWDEIKELLPVLKQRRIYPPEEFAQLEINTFQQILKDCVNEENQDIGLQKLNNCWSSLSKQLTKDLEMRCLYCQLLIELEQYHAANNIIRETVKKQWSDEMVQLFGLVQEDNPLEQLKFAESLLKKQAKNPVLLFSLGQISLMNQLWGKAKDYIRESIDIKPDAEKWYVLGHLYEIRLNDTTNATACYREGLQLCQPERKSALNISDKIALENIDLKSESNQQEIQTNP